MKRVIVIGLDGFSPDLAEKWMGEGRLPHLAAIRARGAVVPLQGVMPPVTYPAWTSCVTGVGPGRHGLLDFTEMERGAYALRFLNSTDRKAPALWNILTGAGRRVCVLGVPGAYPPEPVNGILMGGFDSPVADAIDRSFVYPPSAYEKVRRWRFAEFQEHRITPSWYDAALKALEQKIAVKEAVLLDLLAGERWDFFMAVLGEADTVSHHFWPLEDRDSPRAPALVNGPAHPIRRIYARLDALVGRIMETVAEETLVLVVSDHGFGGAHARALHINNFLAERGWLRYTGGSGSLLKWAALRCLPVRGRGRLFRLFKGSAEKAESRSRFGGIDWPHTRAWSEELDYLPSVRLNLAGREPGGIVADEAYGQVVETLCRELETCSAIDRALPRAAVYEGPCAAQAPDILLELAWEGGYRYSCVRARGGPAMRELPRARWAGGKEAGCSGVHRNPAFLALNRPLAVERPGLLDIAPTVLAYLGVAGPPMEGVSILGDAPIADRAKEVEWTQPSGKSYTTEEAAILEERMRTLGYFE